jgi:Ran GTPase-activating protein (RanGAP) involved in mRNA processing and transport
MEEEEGSAWFLSKDILDSHCDEASRVWVDETYQISDMERSDMSDLQGKTVMSRIFDELADSSLDNLHLDGMYLNQEFGSMIAWGVLMHSSLQILDLANNTLASGAVKIARALEGHRTLKALNLWSNDLGEDVGQAFGRTLAQNSSLTCLVLSENSIGDVGACAIADALKTNTTLRSLSFGCNGITKTGASAIWQALAVNSTLTYLSISCNYLRSILPAARILAASQLHTIELLGCGLKDADCIVIADALKHGVSWKVVNLQLNNLECAAGQALGEALMTNTSLTSLDVSSNKLGAGGCAGLMSGLQHNAALMKLDISRGNNICVEGAEAIAAALRINSSLTDLHVFYDDSISDVGSSAILNSVAHHPAMRHIGVQNESTGKLTLEAAAQVIRHNRRIAEMRFVNFWHGVTDIDTTVDGHLSICEAFRDTPRYKSFICLGATFSSYISMLAEQMGLPQGHDALRNISDLQKYFRDFHMQKVLAWVMGTHSRLGGRSIVHMLSDDAVAHVVGAFFGLPASTFLKTSVLAEAFKSQEIHYLVSAARGQWLQG